MGGFSLKILSIAFRYYESEVRLNTKEGRHKEGGQTFWKVGSQKNIWVKSLTVE